MNPEGPKPTIDHARIVIADDHPLIINGITEIIEKDGRFEIIATHTDGNALLQSQFLPNADVLLLDLNIPGKDGLQVLERLAGLGLKLKVLVLTSYFSKQLSEQCLGLGAKGYLLKSENLEQLADHIASILEGNTIFPDFSPNNAESESEFTFLDEFLKKYNLTKREVEVIQMVCKGHNSSEIAEKLFLSSYTVQTHRRNIFRKLNIESNTIALYKFATKHGLI